MSSSDEATPDMEDKKTVDRSLFVRLLGENSIVVEKSKTPSAITAKKRAWDSITEEYSQTTGKKATSKTLAKMLNNMKSKIKMKTDKKATGNKKVVLKDWEKNFLSILSQEENPVFQKVSGHASAGLSNPRPPTKNDNIDTVEVHPTTSQNIPTTISRKGAKKVLLKETDETKDMTTPQLQRVVLLQQMELQKIQIEKEKMLLENLKKNCNDASTDTVDTVYCETVYLQCTDDFSDP